MSVRREKAMKKMKEPRSKVVVITGASAGLGRATARAFGRAGWSVGLLARGHDGLQGAKDELRAMGVPAHFVITDMSDSLQVESAADQIEAILGPIDVWVNNAMVSVFSPVS